MRPLLALMLAACAPEHPTTDTAHEGVDQLDAGQWYAVSPSRPLPLDDLHECVPPICEAAIMLADNGDVLYSRSHEEPTVRGTWDNPGALTIDGLDAAVLLVDAGHPSYDLVHESGAVRVTAWPYLDPPHEREPGTVD